MLAHIVSRLRTITHQKQPRGIELGCAAVLFHPEPASLEEFRARFEKEFGFELMLLPGQECREEEACQLAKERGFEFVLGSRCCDEVAAGLLLDLF